MPVKSSAIEVPNYEYNVPCVLKTDPKIDSIFRFDYFQKVSKTLDLNYKYIRPAKVEIPKNQKLKSKRLK